MSAAIAKLTPDQEALIPVYRAKWRQIELSTRPIDRKKAASAVKAIYAALDKAEPEIVFCDSPDRAWQDGAGRYQNNLELEIFTYLLIPMNQELLIKLTKRLYLELSSKMLNRQGRDFIGQMVDQLSQNVEAAPAKPIVNVHDFVKSFICSPDLTANLSMIDFCNSVLNCQVYPQKWKLSGSLIAECGAIVPCEKICLLCDRPRALRFDEERRLHGEGEPAIEFADGFSVYVHHGVRVPEKYGKIHPEHWLAEWLLSEENAEVRRVLIQSIGYDRICQELAATQLDTWQEYALLRIDADVDVEPIFLLKMTCPSTGYIHALRVSPDVESAREGIKWVNWGIDPDEFSVQS